MNRRRYLQICILTSLRKRWGFAVFPALAVVTLFISMQAPLWFGLALGFFTLLFIGSGSPGLRMHVTRTT